MYVGRQTRIAGRPAYREICALLHLLGFAGATTFLGVDGTEHGIRRRARFFSTNTEVPVMILAVGDAAQVTAALPRLRELLPTAVTTVERIAGVQTRRPADRPARRAARRPMPAGVPLWQKLTIHTSEGTSDRRRPHPPPAGGRVARRAASAGATVLRGIWGFHGDSRTARRQAVSTRP